VDRREHAREIKYALTNPRELCERLGLISTRGSFISQGMRGLSIRCPWHKETTPSCSVTVGPDGTIRVKCFGCPESGDALSLIAVANGLSVNSDFPEVLKAGAELAGLWGIVQELDTRTEIPNRPKVQPPPPAELEERDYPPLDEVEALWNLTGPVSEDPEASQMLTSRALDPEAVEGLVRTFADCSRFTACFTGPTGATRLPAWARYRGRDWGETGHRLLVPMFDRLGVMRSVRAWRVTEGDSPKRLPPGGHKASELVMADDLGLAMLRGQFAPDLVVVAEGEPDFLVWATRRTPKPHATIGIVSGSWHQALAERFPVGCVVVIRTDHDRAGHAYAAEVSEGLRKRCFIRRGGSVGKVA
jgi:hypothetical protein